MPVFGTTQFGSGGGAYTVDESCRFGVRTLDIQCLDKKVQAQCGKFNPGCIRW